MIEVKIRLQKASDTISTVRFSETAAVGDPLVVGTLYLQKVALEKLGHPEAVEITVRPLTS